MLKIYRSIGIISATLWISACQQLGSDENVAPLTENAEPTVEQKLEESNMSEQKLTVNGRVEFKSFEGGFYAFIADDGRRFTLYKIDKQYLRHGLRLTLTGTPRPDMLTTTQFGTVFEVSSVTNVDESGVTAPPQNPQDL